MASVKSLGIHKPSALPFLVSEGILPPDPPVNLYKWRVITQYEVSKDSFEEELVITERCVVWSAGGVLQQVFRFNDDQETITDAVFTKFPSQGQHLHGESRSQFEDQRAAQKSTNGQLKVKKTRSGRSHDHFRQGSPVPKNTVSEERRSADDRSATCRALVIAFKTQAHVYMISQTCHIIHIPFEVGAVFASCRGVVLQRNTAEKAEPVPTPILPSAPQNTFSYSQNSVHSNAALASSFNLLGNTTQGEDLDPLVLPSLERLMHSDVESQTNKGPLLFCLTDPLKQLGSVVADTRPGSKPRSSSEPSATSGYVHLDRDERLLYVSPEDEVRRHDIPATHKNPLLVALTVNLRHGTTSLWTLTYADNDGESETVHKRKKSNSFRRRSSFASRLSTGATTPVARSFRQPSREAAFDEAGLDKQPELLDSVFEQTTGPTRTSRRVSSLLARADLSTDQDRATFADMAASGQGSRMGRQGASFGVRKSQVGPDQDAASRYSKSRALHDVRSSLDAVSLDGFPLEGRVDGSDDLHDHETIVNPNHRSNIACLKQEIVLHRVYSLAHSNAAPFHTVGSIRETDVRCFTLGFPGHNLSNLGNVGFLICVLYRRLGELLIFQVKAFPRKDPLGARKSQSMPNAAKLELKVTGSRRSGVLDACRISHGSHQWILVLDVKGNSLTLQAPWSSLVKIKLPNSLNLYNPFDVANHSSSRSSGEGGPRRTFTQGLKEISFLEQTSRQGRVSIVDNQGQSHRFQIELKPSNAFVYHVIKVCQAVLPQSDFDAEAMLRGWWDVVSWLETRDEDEKDKEWTALTVLVFSMGVAFITDRKTETLPRQKRRKGGLLRSSSGANTDLENWDEMMRQEGSLSFSMPEWAEKVGAWNWTKSTSSDVEKSHQKSRRSSTSESTSTVPFPKKAMFVDHCTALAREFIKSDLGRLAIGNNGYLPVAASKDSATRRTALPAILVALHLYREELKLDNASAEHFHALTPMLAQLGTWLGWRSWSSQDTSLYMLEDCEMNTCLFENTVITGIQVVPEPFPPPSIMSYLEQVTSNTHAPSFPSLLDVVGAPSSDDEYTRQMIETILMDLTPRSLLLTSLLRNQSQHSKQVQVSRLASAGLTVSLLERLPESVAAPFRAVLSECQTRPSGDWDSRILTLVDREDRAYLDDDHTTVSQPSSKHRQISSENRQHDVHHICYQALEVENVGPYDGSAEVDRQSITRLLFKEDQRFADAASLVHPLQSPVASCAAEPGWTESDLLEAQQELAKIVAMRTLSVSLGRSLLFYSARLPMLTEKFPVHGFALSCTMKPSDTTVTADKTSLTEDKVSWAFFHAGVESGLSISKLATGIDTSWILFNKPRELNNRHAGFLLGLGLSGHLKKIAKWVAFKYLTPKHNITSIGLLLGLSASYLGTMDTLIARLLSVHVTRMLPPGAAELNLSPLTQTCGIFGIGLLYCDTQHRRMSEIMLSEMENMETEDIANPMDALRDEGYRLAAGFSLGLINLGRGKDLKGLQDMHITDRLLTLAVATKIVGQVHMSDSASAGSTMAIALIFMKSNDEALARKIDVPDTTHQFDYVRPDQFLLRTVTKHLIMWNRIKTDHDWIASQIPTIYQRKNIVKVYTLSSEDLPFLNVLAGLCLSIGLRFAGTGNVQVRDLLCKYLDHFMRLCRLPALSYDAKLARITVRNCQDLTALSASCVMAGRGDLVILRRLRSLHGRTDSETPWGSHLAAHFAIGILFLGGGTHTFGTSNLAIASLLCAFYPLFPASVLDNKSHLQAFRHFWVLAAEPRCLIPRDIDTYRPLCIPISITHSDGRSTKYTAPCLLPELHTISQIHTADPEFWPVTLDFASNPKHLAAFRKHQSILLRRRGAYDAANSSFFSATMKALHDKQTVHQLRQQPFEWLFNLPAFRGFDRAERALLLPTEPTVTAGSVVKGIRGTVVDDRLMLETGCLGSGKSERLWNLRLLLAWAEECEKRGEDLGWLRWDVIEGLRARLALWRREGR